MLYDAVIIRFFLQELVAENNWEELCLYRARSKRERERERSATRGKAAAESRQATNRGLFAL